MAVKAKFVKTCQYTGRYVNVELFGGIIAEYKTALINIQTPYLTGRVIAVVTDNGSYDLIIGNIVNNETISRVEIDDWVQREIIQVVETREQARKARESNKSHEPPVDLSSHQAEGQQNNAMDNTEAKNIWEPEKFQLAQQEDPSLEKIFRLARKHSITTSRSSEHSFFIKNNTLQRKYKSKGQEINQLVIPQKYRAQILHHAHDLTLAGHMGRKKTKQRIETTFYWPGMDKDISHCEENENWNSNSSDGVTLAQSENVYSGDTFISESLSKKTLADATENTTADVVSTIQTETSYNSNTFILLESEDETKTESDYSYTESYASSSVFSPSLSSESSTSREWRDITEIVKDIEELGESEQVKRPDLHHSEETDCETENSETLELARQNFLNNIIRRLKLRDLQSPRSLALDAQSDLEDQSFRAPLSGTPNFAESKFCEQMIQRCKTPKLKVAETPKPVDNLYAKALENTKGQVLEHYGLNSAIVERLRLENLMLTMNKKIKDLDGENKQSKSYIKHNQSVYEEMEQQKFISLMTAHVQAQRIEDQIQDHLIKTHPIRWFGDLIKDLPNIDSSSSQILLHYQKQVEKRLQIMAQQVNET
ncbi:uncharacterized protein LOC131954913 [Physella acuta]|uniref:uncharacterized protein LOC131954913 n=1 Tax=Physella acuta TaxID=109671 RepID=UPI0027DE1EAF|nr:uncharacterized protein LOC131954913 [Physella acuta]